MGVPFTVFGEGEAKMFVVRHRVKTDVVED